MARSMLLALGGNAILPHGKSGTIVEQREITLHTMRTLVGKISPGDLGPALEGKTGTRIVP